MRTLLAAVLLFLPALAAAQINVPGDHATVQAAIDAAPPGAVIVIDDVDSAALVINKSLTLIGSPTFTVGQGTTLCADEFACPSITLDGPGAGTVRLVNVVIDGFIQEGTHSGTNGSISGGGFDSLEVVNSIVLGYDAFGPGLGGGQAIAASVDHVVIAGSLVSAGISSFPSLPSFGFNATRAVAGNDITVLDSIVLGSDFGSVVFVTCPSSCDDIVGGTGGTAVVADRLFTSNSTIAGGKGLSSTCDFGLLPCTLPDGPATSVSTETIALSSLPVASSATMAIGSSWSITHGANPLHQLLFGLAAPAPLTTNVGTLFVDPSTLVTVPLFSQLQTIQFDVPNDATLVGLGLALQTFSPSDVLSRPVFVTVVP